MRSPRLAALVVALLMTGAGRALAQDAKAEVSGGWRHLYIAGSDGEGGANIPKGWYLDVGVPVTSMFSIVGDVGGHYKRETVTEVVQGVTVTGTGDVSVHTFMAGVRLRAGRDPRVVPFAQLLLGAARASVTLEGSASAGGATFAFDQSESSTEGALSVGGGVNLAAGSIGIRLQGEWLKILAEDSGNAFRFGVGVVIPF